MLPQLEHLLLCETLFVLRVALEWQRIERVLRVLLVEYIPVSVPPVWKVLRIAAHSENGLLHVIGFGSFFDWRLDMVALKGDLMLRVAVHGMGINDFGLLLQVERLLLFNQ